MNSFSHENPEHVKFEKIKDGAIFLFIISEHASQDHIETMLRECNVFSTINPHDCQHVLPLIAIVMGAGGATGVTNGERHRVGGGGSGSGEDGEDEDEDDNYLSVHMPPLVIYPQTTFGILKLHLRHLRHTRQVSIPFLLLCKLS